MLLQKGSRCSIYSFPLNTKHLFIPLLLIKSTKFSNLLFANMFIFQLFAIATMLTRSISAISLENCLRNENVLIKLPTHKDWEIYSATYNLRLPVTPLIVTLPKTATQVAGSVICAGQFGLKVQAKSGGHSYASFSNGGIDGAMVVDLQLMQGVQLNATTGIVRVGGGVRLGKLAEELYKQANKALSHGTVSQCFRDSDYFLRSISL
jgi:hypothetical protein